MGSHKEKVALGAAIAAGIAGYIFTQTKSDGEDSTKDQAKKNEEENWPTSKLKTVNHPIDIGEGSSKDVKKDDDVKPASTDGEKKEDKTKKDDNQDDDVAPKISTGDIYASTVTETDISKKNPKDDGQDALEK